MAILRRELGADRPADCGNWSAQDGARVIDPVLLDGSRDLSQSKAWAACPQATDLHGFVRTLTADWVGGGAPIVTEQQLHELLQPGSHSSSKGRGFVEELLVSLELQLREQHRELTTLREQLRDANAALDTCRRRLSELEGNRDEALGGGVPQRPRLEEQVGERDREISALREQLRGANYALQISQRRLREKDSSEGTQAEGAEEPRSPSPEQVRELHRKLLKQALTIRQLEEEKQQQELQQQQRVSDEQQSQAAEMQEALDSLAREANRMVTAAHAQTRRLRQDMADSIREVERTSAENQRLVKERAELEHANERLLALMGDVRPLPQDVLHPYCQLQGLLPNPSKCLLICGGG